MPGGSIIERPWDELSEEEKTRATAWAEGVVGLKDKVDRLDRAIAAAEARQAREAAPPPPADRAEIAAMEASSAEAYRKLGRPDGYRYEGGPVAWDEGES